MGDIVFTGHGANVVGSLGSGSLVQDMPSAYSNPSEGDAWVNVGTPDTALELSGATATVSCWVKSIYDNTSFANNNHAVSKYKGTTDKRGYRLGIDNDGGGKMYWAVGLPGAGGAVQATQDVSTYGLDTTEWFHMAGTFDAGVMKLYINGDLATEEDHSASTVEVSGNATVPFEIGAYEAGSRLWYGNMRDVRIWNSSLDITDIQEVFGDVNMAGATATGSLQGWWKMENESLTDSSTNSNNGAQSGTAVWDKSEYNLNQIGSGSVSGTTTISGGTWNLRDSTYMSFDGVDNYIDSNTNLSTILTGSHTISTWCKLTDGHPTSTESLWGSRNSPLDDSCECYISTTGKITYWYMAGGVDEYAGTDAAVFVDNATGWHHVVATMEYIDSSNATMKLYVDGEEVALGSLDGGFAGNMANWSSSIDMAFGASNNNNIPERFLDGKMRDFKIYDSALTSSQIDLLYKGQWVGSPKHWWKLNDGSGDTIVDSGQAGTNGTNNDATWVNPDFTIGGNDTSHELGLSNESTLSAPLGNLFFASGGNYDNYGTFTHNSGTVVVDTNGGTVRVNLQTLSTPSPFIFYDLIVSGSGNGYILGGDCKAETVENSLQTMANTYLAVTDGGGHSDSTLTMGTSTAGGSITIDSGKELYFYNYAAPHLTYLYGACDYDYTDITKTGNIDVGHTGVTHLKNINIIGDWDIGSDSSGTGHNVTLDGDCEFDAVTVSSGDTLDLNGQRAEFGGLFTNSGTLVASGSQLHFTPTSKPALAYGDDIYLGDNDTQWWIYKNDTHRFPTAKSLGTILANQTGNFYSDMTIGSNTNNHTNFLLGGTDACQFTNQHDHEFNNFKLGISSKYVAAAKTTSIHGNMTNGGGMHGVFTASFNGTDDYMKVDDLNTSYNGAATSIPTGYLDAWIRTTASDGTIMHQRNALDTGTGIFMRVVGGKAAAQWKTNGTMPELTGTTDVDDGLWHHIAWRGDGTDSDTSYRFQSLYVDGKLEAHDTTYSGWMIAQTQAIYYGSNSPTTGGGFFDGDISRICIIAGQQNAASANNKIRIPTEADLRRMAFMDYYTFSGTTNFEYSGNVAASPTVQWYQFDKGVGLTAYDYSGWAHVGATGTVSGSADQKDFWYGDGISNPSNFQYDTSTLDFPSTATSSCWGNGINVYNLTCGTFATSVFNFCRFQSEGPIAYYGTFKGGSGSLTRTNGSRPGYEHVGNSSSPWTYMKPTSNFEVDVNNDEFFGDVITYYYASGAAGALPKMKLSTLLATQASGGFIELAGDLEVSSINPDGHGAVRTNGYDIKATYFNPYSSAVSGLRMDAGSNLTFTNSRSWNYTWPDNYNNSFKLDARGEASAIFNTFYDLDNSSNYNYIDTNATIVGTGNPAAFTVSFWYKSPTDLADYSRIYTTAIGFNGSSDGGISLIGSNWLVLCDGTNYRYFNSAPNTDGEWHHMLVYVDPADGYNTRMWVDGSEESGGSTTNEGTTNWSGDVYFGFGDYGAMPVSLADIRFYNAANTPTGSVATLAAINPATDVSGNYADPDNDLTAYAWFKLDGDGTGGVSLTDTIGTYNSAALATGGSPANGVKSGFCTMSGSGIIIGNQGDGRPPTPAGGATLQNFYSSGTVDYFIYSGTVGSTTVNNPLTTKGTVVLD